MKSEQAQRAIMLPALNRQELEIGVGALVRANKALRGTIFYLALAFVCSLVGNIYLATREIEPDAFGITKDGRVYPLSRIEGDIYRTPMIIAWAKEQSEKMYSFTFRSVEGEWPNQLDAFLMPSAKADWIKSLNSQGYIGDVREKAAVMYANVDGEVLYRGKVWNEKAKIDVSVVEVPLKVTLDARNSTTERNREFKVVLQLKIGHVGFNNPKYDGLAIGSFKLVPRR